MDSFKIRYGNLYTEEIKIKPVAEQIYEGIKYDVIQGDVYLGETEVELLVSNDGFETSDVVKKSIIDIDKEAYEELGCPRKLGMGFNYWVKWKEVS